MRPKAVAAALHVLLDAKQPTMLHGSPGVGKSDVVRQVAKERGVELIDLRLSQLDPVDLRGVPSVREGLTHWNTPCFLPTEGKGILFLDEINSAAQATQAAAYQLVLDRALGDYKMPDGWDIIAAGNRTSDRALVNQMSTALRNRFTHIDYECNNEDWCDWALRSDITVEVLGFIRFRPTMLNQFEDAGADKKKAQALKDAKAFATPRSWAFLSKVQSRNPPKELEMELYSGIVGDGPAAEFMGYLKYYRDLPNLDAVLMSPKTAKVPTQPATLYALATGLATKATEDNMERLVEYLLRIPAEFQVLCVKDSIVRNRALTNTKAFNNWAIKNEAVLL